MRNFKVSDENSVDRRTALAYTLAAASALAIGSTVTACDDSKSTSSAPQGGTANAVQPDRDHLSLSLETVPKPADSGKAVSFTISTPLAKAFPIKISSTSQHVTIGRSQKEAEGKIYDLDNVALSKGHPVEIWAVPRMIGSPMQHADIIEITSEHGGGKVDVWIEPTGGTWDFLRERGSTSTDKPLDLDIVPVHASLMSQGGGQVAMWSSPRKRDPKTGKPMRRVGDATQWQWDVFHLNDVEVRSLDLQSRRTKDQGMDKDGGPEKKNIFCGGQAHMPDGRLLVAGGHIVPEEFAQEDEHGEKVTHNALYMYIYDPKAKPTWQQIGAMSDYRWYPTVTTLPDGRMLISAGTREVLEGNPLRDDRRRGFWESYCNNYDIYDPDENALVTLAGNRSLIDSTKLDAKRGESLATYPGVFVLPKGEEETVIAMAEGNHGWLYGYDPKGQPLRPLVRAARMCPMNKKGSRSYPHYGSMVLLPFAAGGQEMTILAVGGQDENSPWRSLAWEGKDSLATDTAEVLHVDTGSSLEDKRQGWKLTGKMSKRRVLCDATLLADGTVLISGGSQRGWGDNNIEPVMEAELYDPIAGKFRLAATAATDRRYHSTALLLPDGTVLKAGSTGGFGPEKGPDGKPNNGPDGKPWFQTHDNAELYYPPYLYRAPRPVITSVQPEGAGAEQHDTNAGPLKIGYAKQFTIRGNGGSVKTGSQNGSKTQAAVVRLGSITHGNNMDQRYVWLDNPTVTKTETGWEIKATTPKNPAAAPPGDYQLIVLDNAGVPSEARFLRFTLPKK